MFIVFAQLLSLMVGAVGDKIPGVKLLRVLRVLRVLRLFSRLKGLSRLCQAVGHATGPVCNAFFMLLLCTAMFSIFGTHYFRLKAPKYFEKFGTSMFTMFQVFTGDGWSDISRTLFVEAEHIDLSVAIFFVSYIFIAGIVLFNVVVAVLLDEFIKFLSLEKDREAATREAELEKMRVTGCLDPLTKTLVLFEDQKELESMIHGIYHRLDTDDSGGLNFEEFREGLKHMTLKDETSQMRCGPTDGIHITPDDFEILTDSGRLLGPNGEFNRQQFTSMMLGELQRYSRRHIKNSVVLSENKVPMNEYSVAYNFASIAGEPSD